MQSSNLKYFIFLVIVLGIYLFINVPLIINSDFLADDLPIIYFSKTTPVTLTTYWENGLQELIPDVTIQSFRYRPFTSFVFYILYTTLGLKPILWAIVSQLNHLINFFLLICIFKKLQVLLGSKNSLYLILPVFYLFYPGNVTNVAWASGRIDLIVVFFCLSSFYFSLKYIEKNNIYFLVASLLLFFTGTLTKENGLSWVIVELLLLWQIYYSMNRSPEIYKSLLKLFKSKVSICILYIFLRSIIAGIDNKSLLANASITGTVTGYLKSLLFTILPVDSGTFIYTYLGNQAFFITGYGIYFIAFGVILFVFLKQKNLVRNLFTVLIISFVTLIFYSIAGGGMYRLFTLTFVSLLVSFFILACSKEILLKRLKFPLIAASAIVFIFFVYGSGKISDYWLQNYRLQNESITALVNVYEKEKDNIVLNYPHALGQTYCYADIGTYLYFKVNGTLGRFNNITELAAINSHSIEHYLKGSKIDKDSSSFILTSDHNDTFFSPGAFFSEKSELGQKYLNLKNFSFQVLKLNSFSKPVSVKLESNQNFIKPVNFIKYTNGKFEKY